VASQELIIIGGGEHARVVAEAAQSVAGRWRILGFVDPLPCAETCARSDLIRLGNDDALAEHRDALAVLGFGGLGKGKARAHAVARASKLVKGWASIVHDRAWVSPTAVVEPGAVVMAGAVVQTGATIGAHAIVNSGAVVEHDVVIGDFAQISPGAIIGGAGRVGRHAFLGLGAVVRDHIEVGEGSTIGMGAAVVANVPSGAVVMGVPAKRISGTKSKKSRS
jgi:acetyltransferase EpsM